MQLQHVSKAYDSVPILQGFSLTLSPNTLTCLMASSGRGKTTLLRLLLGLTQPDSGHILDRPLRLSAVFQEDRLLLHRSALDNLLFVRPDPAPDAQILLTKLGLPESRQPVSQYSGGMKRRVAIARALWAESDLLCLDEPFSGLDVDTKEQVMAVISQHITGRIVVLATHDPGDATYFGVTPLYLPQLG